jgi:glyoxylase-like metal-dependent hydrolase (beta-lactamase superfamily II)
MLFRQLFDPETSTFTYLLADRPSGEAILIDPVADQVERDFRLLDELNLTLKYCLDTHVHADHVTGAGQLREKTGCETGVSAAAGVGCADHGLQHGDIFGFGSHQLEVRATPGHTSSCLTFVVRHDEQVLAFTGDTLFIRGCGRTDFQQGDARSLYRSVHQQIFSLPENTKIYPGHDYNGHQFSTVAEEKAHNPRLNITVDEDRFVDIMNNLDLGLPKQLHVAVPANLGCGLNHESEAASATDVPEVHPSDIVDRSHWRILDVREPHEWTSELRSIDGADRVPQGRVVEAVENWSRDDKLLIVCRSGRRSKTVAGILINMGFLHVSNLAGGMIAWHETQKSRK